MPFRNSGQRTRWRLRGQVHNERQGNAWTFSEDVAVEAHSITDRALSALIGRSVSAIQVRRNKLRARA